MSTRQCFRTPQEFAKAVCRENNQTRAKATSYFLTDRKGRVRMETKAPKSYRGLTKAVFCVGHRFATKKFGVWVEEADSRDEAWLMQRQMRKALDDLLQTKWPYCLRAPDNVETEVEQKLNLYLQTATLTAYDEFYRNVLEETKRLMEQDGCFSILDSRGDLLNEVAA